MTQLVPGEASFVTPVAGEVEVSFEAEATLVRLAGEVDLMHGPELAAAAHDATERGLPVRVDASSLTFLDSTAVGFLAVLVRSGREQGWRIVVSGASRLVSETLSLAGLSSEIDLAP